MKTRYNNEATAAIAAARNWHRLLGVSLVMALLCAACAPAAQPYMRAETSGDQVQSDLEGCTFEGRDRTAQALPRLDEYSVVVRNPEQGPAIVQTRLQAAAKSGAQTEYRTYVDEQVRAYVNACMQGKGYSASQ